MVDIASHSFWDELAAARRERRPTAWTLPFGGPIASADEVFEAMLEVGRRRRDGDQPLSQRLYGNGKPLELEPSLMPVAHDGSMAGYVARLSAIHGDSGFVVNDFQAADAGMWRCAAGVMAGLMRGLGAAWGGGSFELFAGDYRSGFFGVHKDDQEVVTFVVEGRKRFLLWPFEVLRDHPAVPPHAEHQPVLLDGFDYAHLRASAIVIEGGPGDVFYWPADYWHVAEADGGLCTTVGVGLFTRTTPVQMLERAARELTDEGVLPRPGDLPAPVGGDARGLVAAALGTLGAALDHPAVEARIEDNLLTQTSAYGFNKVPPAGAAQVGERVRMAPGALVWLVRGDELVWSVGGAIYRYPAVDALAKLFGWLASGALLEVDAMIAELEHAIEPAAVRHVLALMAKHHALRP